MVRKAVILHRLVWSIPAILEKRISRVFSYHAPSKCLQACHKALSLIITDVRASNLSLIQIVYRLQAPRVTILNFVQSLLRTWQTRELVKWQNTSLPSIVMRYGSVPSKRCSVCNGNLVLNCEVTALLQCQ
jgi:hypothetical protein